MTLCIAAICQQRQQERIVVSSDWKQESGFAGSEIQEKLYWIRDDWPALVAGTLTRAVQLKDTYRTFLDRNLAQMQGLYRSEIANLLNQPLILYKHQLADEFIGSRLGIPYDVFLANGKAWLPEPAFSDLLTAVRRISLDCQLLLPMYLDGDAYVWRVNDENEAPLEYCDNFAAIGSGMQIAEATLCHRVQEAETTLEKTIYHVFEAGKLASLSGAPGVGKDHTISILYPPDGKNSLVMKSVSPKGYKLLEAKFREYGPKRVTSFAFDEKLLDVDFEVPKPSTSPPSVSQT